MVDTITLAAAVATASDPDAQTTITDFVDYTEYYPSDLFRSLTLIGKLDDSYHQQVASIHELSKAYGALQSIPQDQRPDPQDLRKRISIALDHSLRSREASYSEASRLCNLTDSLFERLQGIRNKLEAQPKPPSRDSTPVPPPSRNRKTDTDRQPRIKLLNDGHARGNAPRPQGAFSRRRIIIPGEVLPPRDPNSPEPSLATDSEPERPASPVRPPPRPSHVEKDKTPKPPKPPKPDRPRGLKVHKVRPPGVMGTNVHSTVAGISVSNAMAQLSMPPENPALGSKHAPWLKLTEWELHQIRKRMKKNADWMPSAIMVKRELHEKNRGEDFKRKAKEAARENGEPFLDEEPEAFVRHPLHGRMLSSEPPRTKGEEDILVNRGMRLNEAKRHKREQMALKGRSDDVERGVSDATMTEFVPNPDTLAAGLDAVAASYTPVPDLHTQSKKGRKRKRAPSLSANLEGEGVSKESAEVQQTTTKKIKLAPPGPTGPHDAKLKLKDMSASAQIIEVEGSDTGKTAEPHTHLPSDERTGKASKRTSRSSMAATRSENHLDSTTRNTPVASEQQQHPAIASSVRPRSRGSTTSIKLTMPTKKAASAEPQKPRPSHRRTSDAGLVNTKAATAHERNMSQLMETAASRRAKRPAPGVLALHLDGQGANAGFGKRKSITSKGKMKTEEGNELIDDIRVDQTRYCLCNDVSHGDMIACDNPTCPIEWYHVGCVDLEDEQKTTRLARLHWYCPTCRVEAGVGGDGIVRV